jgi:hypothetical protein
VKRDFAAGKAKLTATGFSIRCIILVMETTVTTVAIPPSRSAESTTDDDLVMAINWPDPSPLTAENWFRLAELIENPPPPSPEFLEAQERYRRLADVLYRSSGQGD